MKKNERSFIFVLSMSLFFTSFFLNSTAMAITDVEITASRGTFEDSIEINWDPVSFADRYQILRSDNYNGPYLEKGWVKKSAPAVFIDSKVQNGKYYWYKLRPWYWTFPGKSTKKSQGWVTPKMTTSDTNLMGQLFNLLGQISHFLNVRNMAGKCEKSLPEAVNIDDLIPSDGEIYSWVENICKTDHRRIGSPESKAGIEYITKELENILGPENVKKDTFDLDFVYNATEYSLIIDNGDEPVNFDCFYVKNTGMSDTLPEGGSVSGEMIWAGEGTKKDFDELGDIEGKIVVAQCDFTDVPLGLLDTLFSGGYYKSDTNDFINMSTKYPQSAGRSNFPSGDGDIPNDNSAYYLAKSRGARALILTMKNFPGDTNEYGGPYDNALKSMPCLWVSGYKEEELKSLIDSGASATVTIKGSCNPGTGQNIYGILPGNSDETIMITSHHDSLFKGATEDGTGVAMVLAQAKAWALVDMKLREKTIIFVIADGHHYDGIGAEIFGLEDPHNVMDKVIVDINLEHLASKGVDIDADGRLVDAGRPALNLLFMTDNPVPISTATRMLKNREPELTMAVQSTIIGDVPPGEAGHYHMVSGVDFIHWLGVPAYLLDGRDTMDKVDINQLNYMAKCVSELVGTYMALPEAYSCYK